MLRMVKMNGLIMTILFAIREVVGREAKRRPRLRSSRPPAEPIVEVRCASYATITPGRAHARTHTHTADGS